VSVLAIVLLLAADDTATLKQEIVVTAAREEQPRDRAAAAVTVLDRAAIAALPATSLSEVLSFVPGLTMFFEGGASGLPMMTSRGFFGGGEVEYVKLIVDGVPAGDAESGNVDWQRFRAADIDRVEVLHGPGSALYGDTAVGGVIQVFTRASAGSTVRLGAGSFGAADVHASYRHAMVGVTAGAWRTDGFREQSHADGWHGQVRLERSTDRARWRVDAGADSGERHQPGPLARDEIARDREQSHALFRFDGQTTTRARVGASFDAFGVNEWRATVYGAHRDDENLRTLLLAPGFGTSAFRDLTTRAGGGTFEIARGAFRAGTDVERASLSGEYASVNARGETGNTVASQDGRRDRIGLFVTGGWRLADRYELTAGLRRDDVRDEMSSATQRASAWSPRLGLNVHVGGAALFVQASHAFKAPTLDQLFDPRPYPDGTGGTFTISSSTLRPQRARNFEAGVSRSAPAHAWSVVAYRMSVRDEIDFDPQTFSYRNLGRSLHRGIEAHARVAKTSRVSPEVTYAWTRVADAEARGRQLKNIPEHAAQLLLHVRVTERTRANAIWRWRDAFTLDDEGTFETPSVSRVDLRVAHELGALRLEADVLNALGARYNELGYVLGDFNGRPVPLEFPAPGRALRLGVTWAFR
jgi:outer membrane cobalamin receptor